MTFLTRHFTREQLERSEYAQRNGLANKIPEEQIPIWTEGLEVLVEPLMLYEPGIVITSAFRSEELNRKLGGSKNSQHTGLFWMAHRKPPKHVACCAFDLEILLPGGNRKLWNLIATRQPKTFDQLIWEFGDDQNPAWVHISYVPNEVNRRQVLRVQRIKDNLGNNRSVYSNIELMPGQPENRLAQIVNPQPPLSRAATIAGGSANHETR